jgi:hypothetical protein
MEREKRERAERVLAAVMKNQVSPKLLEDIVSVFNESTA